MSVSRDKVSEPSMTWVTFLSLKLISNQPVSITGVTGAYVWKWSHLSQGVRSSFSCRYREKSPYSLWQPNHGSITNTLAAKKMPLPNYTLHWFQFWFDVLITVNCHYN
jgi:hypothetical protein